MPDDRYSLRRRQSGDQVGLDAVGVDQVGLKLGESALDFASIPPKGPKRGEPTRENGPQGTELSPTSE